MKIGAAPEIALSRLASTLAPLVPGEGHREISWIWRASTYNPEDATPKREMHEGKYPAPSDIVT